MRCINWHDKLEAACRLTTASALLSLIGFAAFALASNEISDYQVTRVLITNITEYETQCCQEIASGCVYTPCYGVQITYDYDYTCRLPDRPTLVPDPNAIANSGFTVGETVILDLSATFCKAPSPSAYYKCYVAFGICFAILASAAVFLTWRMRRRADLKMSSYMVGASYGSLRRGPYNDSTFSLV